MMQQVAPPAAAAGSSPDADEGQQMSLEELKARVKKQKEQV